MRLNYYKSVTLIVLVTIPLMLCWTMLTQNVNEYQIILYCIEWNGPYFPLTIMIVVCVYIWIHMCVCVCISLKECDLHPHKPLNTANTFMYSHEPVSQSTVSHVFSWARLVKASNEDKDWYANSASEFLRQIIYSVRDGKASPICSTGLQQCTKVMYVICWITCDDTSVEELWNTLQVTLIQKKQTAHTQD